MRAPTVANMLDIWERGLPKGPVERGVMLLELTCSEEQGDAVAALSVGERDRRLLALRASVFGPRVVGLVACPVCGEKLELELGVDEILAPAPAEPSDLILKSDDHKVWLRLPDSLDMMAAAGATTTESARVLFRRCVVRAELDGSLVDSDALPDEVMTAAGQKLADADPLADLRFNMTCIACDHAWQAPFDAAAFLWAELESWADRMLREVHELAIAYGWAERDILSLGPIRRARYLRMVEG